MEGGVGGKCFVTTFYVVLDCIIRNVECTLKMTNTPHSFL